MTKFPCDLCGASDRLPIPGDPSGLIGICKSCAFVYISERRSVEEIAKAWTDIYVGGHYNAYWPGVQARLFYVAQWMNEVFGLGGAEMLDIGAGNGLFLRYVSDRGAVTCGIDPDADNCRRLTEIPPGPIFWGCHQMYAHRDAEPVGKFHFVNLNWTLENTGDCMSILEYAKSCLKPDGHIVVATGSRILVPFKKPYYDYIPKAIEYPHDTHCFRWSLSSLKQAFAKIGMHIQDYNDFMVRDEMIVVAGEKPSDLIIHDDKPEDVLNYFANWRRAFP